MKKRILALIMAVVLVFSLAACGNKPTATPDATPTPTNTPSPTPTKAPVPAVEGGEASINFEDGNFGFMAVYRPTATSDKSDLQILTLDDGTKAVYAENTLKKNETHIGVDLSALLGDKISEVKTIKMDLGSKSPNGFYAISGKIYLYSGEGNSVSTASDFAVYMENKNPKTVTVEVKNAFVAGQNNYMDIAKLSDSAYEEAKRNNKVSDVAVGLTVDNIKFLDANGNLINVDSSVLVSEDAPFVQKEETTNTKQEFAYGSSVYLEATNPGDWSKTADIPASFFEGATGPVSVVLEVEIADKPDYALIGPRTADWKDLDHSYVIGLNENKDTAPWYFYQADNSIVFNDVSTTKVSFAITKEGAAFLAEHGGLSFIGHNAWAKKATISYDTFECAVDATLPGDWLIDACHVIPADYFAALEDKGNVSITLGIEIGDKPDYVGFKACTPPSWGMPDNKESIVCTRDNTNLFYYIGAEDPAFSVVDKSLTEIYFELTPEAVKYYAENGGMAFPGHLITVKSAKLSTANYSYYMEAAAPGDWAKNADIPAEVFKDATGNIGIVLEVEVAEKPDYALIGPRTADWKDLDHSHIVGLIEDKDTAPHYFYQADNSIVLNDFSLTKVCFTITKECAAYLAEHGGLSFIGHNTWVKKAYVSTNRYETYVDPTLPGDWLIDGCHVIPAEFFADAPNGISIALTVEIGDKPDYVGFKACTPPSWGMPDNKEAIVCTRDNTNPFYYIGAEDPAFSVVDKSITQFYFDLTAEGAAYYAANGGMAFPGHLITVKSAVVVKK